MSSEIDHPDKDLLLAAAEARLSETELGPLQAHLASCAECQTQLHALQFFHQAAGRWVDAPVPNWARDSAIPKSVRPGLGWLNYVSLGASLAALVLVALRVEVRAEPHGYSVAFGGGASTAALPADTEAVLARKFQDFELRQTASIERRLAEQHELSRDTTWQLLKVAAQQHKRERRDDLETLLNYWELQRESDSVRVSRQVRTVSQEQAQSRRVLQSLLHNLDAPAAGQYPASQAEHPPVNTESL